ncbi:hypothetical protein CONPUDRAFT_80011 [Coniophora puteana RWD-64-598 SS2]|uniref:Zinc-ribbon 15 domain-containing protein n=1 Tax=Coniophora puteana (strain RWD-64-598) TaxID=741705 RepID=A0A5M3N1Z6_CONPW|nr:uncharacterized protein CONPUDRAFT_80011 [Coniophora puteana RWD-64-598 SS2]EIW85410.1 hypothetical protein CONPUDRAFT_80011 [Coniophora puteana RWD-64-598 SS2]
MDFIFCIPIMVGCPTKIKPEGENQGGRICPRCHNASMFAAKSRQWFEFCFVPLIPFKTRHVWMCSICQLQVDTQQGWEPPVAHPQGNFQRPGIQGPPQGSWGPQGDYGGSQYQGGYQPQYIQPGTPKHN